MQGKPLAGDRGASIAPAVGSLSIVVPAHNGGGTLVRCLEALREAEPQAELIVVDDASVPDLRAIAKAAGATYLRMTKQSGPAATRNVGWRAAHGGMILFVDSDVVVSAAVVGRICQLMAGDSGLAGVFGSYDDAPAEPGFYSQFRNLLHHYVHQTSSEQATTFWSGFGVLRREALERAGGFDEQITGMEDVDLGMRLTAGGERMLLDKSLQVQHLKRWTFWSAARTDIFLRAIPWTRLLLDGKGIRADLNLTHGARASGVLAVLLLAALAWTAAIIAGLSGLSFIYPLGVVLSLSAVLILLNRDFYGFLMRKRGLGFTCRAIPAHWFYYLYSSAAFAVAWLEHMAGRLAGKH
jgi:GT2 family glycosyltransferase